MMGEIRWIGKRVAAIVSLLVLTCAAAGAGTLDGSGTYRGTIRGVAVGFFGHVGVGLTDNATCNGQPWVILKTTNSQYKEMMAVLLAAEAAGTSVRMYQVQAQIEPFLGVNTCCVITSVSLGDFVAW